MRVCSLLKAWLAIEILERPDEDLLHLLQPPTPKDSGWLSASEHTIYCQLNMTIKHYNQYKKSTHNNLKKNMTEALQSHQLQGWERVMITLFHGVKGSCLHVLRTTFFIFVSCYLILFFLLGIIVFLYFCTVKPIKYTFSLKNEPDIAV